MNVRRNCNNINRNTNIFSHIRNNIPRHNLVEPDFFVNQLWLQEEDTNGVKIIELKSSSSSKESSIKNGEYSENHLNRNVLEDNYCVNEEARQRRRMKNEHNFTPRNEYVDESNPFYSTYDSGPINHQMNCFTIINNQNYSDSSSDEKNYDAVEIIEVDNTDESYWDHVYKEEVGNYDPNTQPEKRTVWIYSYKNKKLLSENDLELVNIPSRDTYSSSTSHSISDEEETVTKCRIGSPIPTYIPKLNLSLVQTLSTVTEVSEQKSSNRSSQEHACTKIKNNWFTDRNDKVKTARDNVLNWMALSPRERRRRSINTTSETTLIHHEVDVTCPEGDKIEINERSNKTVSRAVQVKADVHSGSNIQMKPIEIELKRKETPIAHNLPMDISFAESEKDQESDECYELDDRKIPCINIESKINRKEITGPIEKLDCNNWIAEQDEEIVHEEDFTAENDIEDYPKSIESDIVSKRLWAKNLQLMKPPQWMEYLPITCSPPSLHLSLSLPSIDRKKSWFKRLTRCIKCCK